jgi:hypothetical protein
MEEMDLDAPGIEVTVICELPIMVPVRIGDFIV